MKLKILKFYIDTAILTFAKHKENYNKNNFKWKIRNKIKYNIMIRTSMVHCYQFVNFNLIQQHSSILCFQSLRLVIFSRLLLLGNRLVTTQNRRRKYNYNFSNFSIFLSLYAGFPDNAWHLQLPTLTGRYKLLAILVAAGKGLQFVFDWKIKYVMITTCTLRSRWNNCLWTVFSNCHLLSQYLLKTYYFRHLSFTIARLWL